MGGRPRREPAEPDRVIVVDTTVWVDFFRGADAPHVAELIALVEQDAGVGLTDVILTEVLQGLRTDQQARRVEQRLKAFDILQLQDLGDFVRAAELYRTARSKGYTVRRTIDCLWGYPLNRRGAGQRFARGGSLVGAAETAGGPSGLAARAGSSWAPA